jgi:ABC-type nitrate/sulfonate/bicarbonate transport system substrate-binding protein
MRNRIVLLSVVALVATACQGGGAPATGTPPTSTTAGATATATSTATSAPGTATATATAGTSVAPPGQPESTRLRVAFSGQPDFTQVMNFKWIDDMKAKHGVEAEQLIFEGTAPPFRAMVSGEADIVVGQVPPGVLLVKETGAKLKMIAGDVASSDYLLISTPDVKQLSDLYGKKVGTAGPGAVSDSLTQAALKRENIDTSRIEFVQIGGTGARMAALLSNQVQAGAAHAAEGYDAVSKGLNELHPIADSLGPYLFHGMWATEEWLNANPNLAQLTVDEFINTVRWAQDNKAEYIATAKTKVEGLSDEAMDKAYDLFLEIDLFAVNGGLTPELVKATTDLEQEVGGLPADIPDASVWVDDRYVQSYLARNGSR